MNPPTRTPVRLALALFLLALLPRVLTLRLGSDVDTASILLRCRTMAEGKLLYRDIYCNKTPLLFLAGRCLYRLWPGRVVEASRVLMVLLSASCAVPVFLMGRRLYGGRVGAAAAVLFALDPHSVFYARQFHTSVAEAALAFWTVWVFLLALDAGRGRGGLCLLAGVAAGMGFLTKQSAATLAALFVLMALARRGRGCGAGRLRGLLAFCAGFSACLVAVGLYFAWRGGWADLWRSVVGVNLELRQAGMAAERVGTLWAKAKGMFLVASRNKWLWLLALFGLCHGLWRRDRRLLVPAAWLILQGLFLLLVYYQDFDHYFLPWIAPLCIVAGYGFFVLVDLFRRSAAADRLAGETRAVLLFLGVAFAGLGMKFVQLGRKDYAAFALVAASATWLRAVLGRGDDEARAGWPRVAALLLGALMVAGALVPYWVNRYNYPEPYLSAQAERDMADWIRSRLRPGEDVAVLANHVLTIYGGWRDLPVVWRGRKVWNPRGVGDALRPYTPDPKLLKDTLALWRGDCRVRFVVLYQEHLDRLDRPENRPLREYLERGFRLAKAFDYPTGDYYGQVRVYEAVASSGGSAFGPASWRAGRSKPYVLATMYRGLPLTSL